MLNNIMNIFWLFFFWNRKLWR